MSFGVVSEGSATALAGKRRAAANASVSFDPHRGC
jgi:hypothetical protein